MKARFLLLTGVLVFTAASAYATKGIEDGSKYGTGEDSVRCTENVSLLSSYYKIKSYDDAYNSFKIVYDECPQALSKTQYGYGVTLIKHKLTQETDKAKKSEWFHALMDCYEMRIKYYGTDSKYPESYIRGRQAVDYITLSGDDNAITTVLPWLEKSYSERGENTQADVIDYYFRMLDQQYKTNPDQYRESYIQRYLDIEASLNAAIAKADEKTVEGYQLTKNNVNAVFIASGAADCKTLDDVFAAKVELAKDSANELITIMKLYRSANCTESDIFFQAAEYAHKLNPSAETAAGCGFQYIKKKEINTAIKYFNEAFSLVQDGPDAASQRYDYQYILAGLYMMQNRYSEARSAANKAISYNSHEGEPYLIIAQIYADPSVNPYKDDALLSKTVYWAAAEKAEQAKAVDPECASRAQALINQYRKHFPSKEDMFFKPEFREATFHVGGFINETVRCRQQ